MTGLVTSAELVAAAAHGAVGRVIEEIMGKPSRNSSLDFCRSLEFEVDRMSLRERRVLKRKIKAALPGLCLDVAYNEWDEDEIPELLALIDAEALASLEA